jgi:hypothetical protein
VHYNNFFEGGFTPRVGSRSAIQTIQKIQSDYNLDIKIASFKNWNLNGGYCPCKTGSGSLKV